MPVRIGTIMNVEEVMTWCLRIQDYVSEKKTLRCQSASFEVAEQDFRHLVEQLELLFSVLRVRFDRCGDLGKLMDGFVWQLA